MASLICRPRHNTSKHLAIDGDRTICENVVVGTVKLGQWQAIARLRLVFE
jgi:hypothetical protein